MRILDGNGISTAKHTVKVEMKHTRSRTRIFWELSGSGDSDCEKTLDVR